MNKLYEGPRSEKRAKRRKINRILNILIGIVLFLILFFGWKLLFSSSDQRVAGEIDNTQTEQQQPVTTNEEEEQVEETTTDTEPDTTSETEEESQANEMESESSEHEKVTQGDPASNVIRSIENQAWKPIGTNQSEPHTTVYDNGSTDRLEMERAISYATGVDQSNLIVWWLARNGEDKVAATVATRDNEHIYRVYIDWVPNQGWKPTLIEELRENDAPSYKKQASASDDDDDDDDD